MDKSKIPTEKFIIEDEEQKIDIEMYKWMTQEEEDTFDNLRIGNRSLGSEEKFTIPYSVAIEARNYRLKALLISPKFEDLNIMSPSIREKIMIKVIEIVDKKKS